MFCSSFSIFVVLLIDWRIDGLTINSTLLNGLAYPITGLTRSQGRKYLQGTQLEGKQTEITTPEASITTIRVSNVNYDACLEACYYGFRGVIPGMRLIDWLVGRLVGWLIVKVIANYCIRARGVHLGTLIACWELCEDLHKNNHRTRVKCSFVERLQVFIAMSWHRLVGVCAAYKILNYSRVFLRWNVPTENNTRDYTSQK